MGQVGSTAAAAGFGRNLDNEADLGALLALSCAPHIQGKAVYSEGSDDGNDEMPPTRGGGGLPAPGMPSPDDEDTLHSTMEENWHAYELSSRRHRLAHDHPAGANPFAPVDRHREDERKYSAPRAEGTSGCRFPVHVAWETRVRPRVYQLVSDSRFGKVVQKRDFKMSATLEWEYFVYYDHSHKKHVSHSWKANKFREYVAEFKPVRTIPVALPDSQRTWRPTMDVVQRHHFASREVQHLSNAKRKRTKMSGQAIGMAGTRTVYQDIEDYHARVKRIEVERNRYKIAEPAVYLGGALPGLLGSGKPIRRRALLIACSYPPPKETNLMIGDKRFLSQETDVDLPGETPKQRRDNRKDNEQSRTVDLQRALPNTIVDLKKVYDMLLNCRGFVPDEIVVLTDADDENELVRSIKDKGTRVEYSGSENVLRWMCRLASGLGVKAASFEESGHDHVNDVATSLFLYFGGHGSSRPEFGSESLLTTHQQAVVGTEEDLRDEMLMLSDYQRVWLGPRPKEKSVREQELSREQNYVETGTIVDNVINQVLVDPVIQTPNCQLLLVFDTCMSGSIADLPMVLHNKAPLWVASDWARRDEMFLGIRPMEWDCGEGSVFCISAAEDWKSTYDLEGGILTHALIESRLNRTVSSENSLTLGGFFDDIRNGAARHRERLRGKCEELGMQAPIEHNPVLSSSHFCSLSTPLFI